MEERLLNIRFPLTPRRLVGWSALTGEVLNIADVYALDPQLPYGFDASVDRELNYRAVSMLTVPLRSTTGEVVGVLQLINRRTANDGTPLTAANAVALTRPFDAIDQRLIEALASQAAVCVERTRLIEDQARLVEAIISLVAGAIDAKSSHTGGHCARVPELALMLAREAEQEAHGPLAAFRFTTEAQWREFRIGAWLHDCGKVTTPDFVVDKATKLETLHNRIHEIRTRFEVLLRDARIARLEGSWRAVIPRFSSRPTGSARGNWRSSSPSWPPAMWARRRWSGIASSGCVRSDPSAGCVTSMTAWASPGGVGAAPAAGRFR